MAGVADEQRASLLARSCDIFDVSGDGDEDALLYCNSDDEDEWEIPVVHEVKKHWSACLTRKRD